MVIAMTVEFGYMIYYVADVPAASRSGDHPSSR